MNLTKQILSLVLGLLLVACTKNDIPEPEPEEEDINEYIISYESVASYSVTQLKTIASIIGFSDMQDEIKYSVEVYSVTYHTSYNDSDVVASGLIIIPLDVDGELPLMSLHHGTIFANEDAPSDYDFVSEKELIAATGYFTVIPDYIGFGTTAEILHPYYDKENIVQPVIDMINAGKECAEDESIGISNKLFLFGYSEGGYVSMATHEYIESLNDPKFRVTASALGAGGYDLLGVLDELLEEPTYPYPSYLGYIVHSYNTTNNWGHSLSNYFREPYASLIPDLYDGSKTGNQINAELTTNLEDLLDSNFIDTLENQYPSNIISELGENSVHDWQPGFPIRMYHGTNDEIVPYEDSQETYNGFVSGGANNVEFITIPGGDHSSSIYDMARDAIIWFKAFQIP